MIKMCLSLNRAAPRDVRREAAGFYLKGKIHKLILV